MLHELSHRSKNLLSIVQSMASQVARRTDNFDDFFSGFSRRLRALSEIHDLLIVGDWRGADIRDLVRTQLVPFHDGSGRSIVVQWSELRLTPKAAEQIGLALHELGTNAAKHGALSAAQGAVNLRWAIVKMTARARRAPAHYLGRKSGGPAVNAGTASGLPARLSSRRSCRASLQGTASLDFAAKGVKWLLVVPSASVLVDGSGMANIESESIIALAPFGERVRGEGRLSRSRLKFRLFRLRDESLDLLHRVIDLDVEEHLAELGG